jgi:hypothetical protein
MSLMNHITSRVLDAARVLDVGHVLDAARVSDMAQLLDATLILRLGQTRQRKTATRCSALGRVRSCKYNPKSLITYR